MRLYSFRLCQNYQPIVELKEKLEKRFLIYLQLLQSVECEMLMGRATSPG